MSTYVPDEVLEKLAQARIAGLRKTSKLTVRTAQDSFRVLRMWADGFSVEDAVVPPLRGLVDLFDGDNHLCQCLIVAAEQEAGEMRYDFKRRTEVTDRPPLDYYRGADAPVALLGRDG